MPCTPSQVFVYFPFLGDEILDIHGKSVTGLEVAEVVEILRSVPEKFMATVRPITALRKGYQADMGKIIYSEIVPTTANSPTGGKTFIVANGNTAIPPPVSATPVGITHN